MKIFLILLSILIIFTGCENTTIKQYNELSVKHQEKNQAAFAKITSGINSFNKQDYPAAAKDGDECYILFSQAKDLSTQTRDLAAKIKNKQWLVQFKKYAMDAEDIRMKQCKLLSEAATASKNKQNDVTQKNINQISDLNNNFNKLQAAMDDIKNQHPDSFK